MKSYEKKLENQYLYSKELDFFAKQNKEWFGESNGSYYNAGYFQSLLNVMFASLSLKDQEQFLENIDKSINTNKMRGPLPNSHVQYGEKVMVTGGGGYVGDGVGFGGGGAR